MGAVCAKNEKGRTTELPKGKAKKNKELDAGGPRPIQPKPIDRGQTGQSRESLNTGSRISEGTTDNTPVKRYNSTE